MEMAVTKTAPLNVDQVWCWFVCGLKQQVRERPTFLLCFLLSGFVYLYWWLGLPLPCRSRIKFAAAACFVFFFLLKVETHKSLKNPAGKFSPTAARLHIETSTASPLEKEKEEKKIYPHIYTNDPTLSLASSPLIVSTVPPHSHRGQVC